MGVRVVFSVMEMKVCGVFSVVVEVSQSWRSFFYDVKGE